MEATPAGAAGFVGVPPADEVLVSVAEEVAGPDEVVLVTDEVLVCVEEEVFFLDAYLLLAWWVLLAAEPPAEPEEPDEPDDAEEPDPDPEEGPDGPLVAITRAATPAASTASVSGAASRHRFASARA